MKRIMMIIVTHVGGDNNHFYQDIIECIPKGNVFGGLVTEMHMQSLGGDYSK